MALCNNKAITNQKALVSQKPLKIFFLILHRCFLGYYAQKFKVYQLMLKPPGPQNWYITPD